jgi:cytochrome c
VCGAALGAACGGAPPRLVPGGDAQRGPAAIANYGCGSCHVIPGIRSAVGTVGPPLTDFGRRASIAGYLPNTADDLVTWIVKPQAVAPGNAMLDLGVDDRSARDIAAYLYAPR